MEFVNSENPEVHTQNIERAWKSLKSCIKREGRPSESDDLYIFEFLYRQMERAAGRSMAGEMFLPFVTNISKVYPGNGLQGLELKTYTE